MTEGTDPTRSIDLLEPAQGPPAPPSRETGATFHARLKAPDPLRIGLVLGGLLAIVLAATVTLGASPSPSGGSAGGSQPGNGKSDRSGAFPFGGLQDRSLLGALGGRGGLRGFGQITITAVSGSNLSLKTEDGWTRTIAVTASTTITKGGQKIALGDLKVGDAIRFGQTRNADGSFAITQLTVVVPRMTGTVTAVSGNGFTLSRRDGTTWTVTVSSSTTYTVGRLAQKAGSLADVKVGSEVVALGTQGSGNTLSAMTVRVALPTIAGQVTAKSGSTITVRRPDGTTATIRVGAGTTYRVRGASNAGLANVTIGMGIVAEGTQRSDGSLDATSVAAGQLKGRLPGRLPKFQAPGAVPSPASPG